jgi:formylglycine-generating enzyme required for sulfatase activity
MTTFKPGINCKKLLLVTTMFLLALLGSASTALPQQPAQSSSHPVRVRYDVPKDPNLVAYQKFLQVARLQTTQEKPLTEEEVAALLDTLKEGLPKLVEDEEAVAAIEEKWDAREDLVGKPLSQAVRLLFADVRSVIDDKETLAAIWKDWNEADDAEEEEVAAKPTPQPAPVRPVTQPNVAAQGPKAGTVSRSKLPGGVEMTFSYIPAGEFKMGGNGPLDEANPVRTVRLSKAFWMQTTEVTQAQWMAVVGDLPKKCRYTDENKEAIPERQRGDLYPVVCVSLTDVQEFLRNLNEKKDGYRYRLPTEAEWEYAARAGTVGDYAGDFNSIVVHGVPVRQVASKKPNGWGLHDMHGNVSEYVQDMMTAYPAGTVTDPVANRGSYPILRGGSVGNPVNMTRSASRLGTDGMLTGAEIIGFRVVRIKE